MTQTEHPGKNATLFHMFFLGALCILPLIGVIVPRFMAYAPALIGLCGFITYRMHFGTWPIIPKFLMITAIFVVFYAGLSHFWAVDPDFALKRTGKMSLIILGGVLLTSVSLTTSFHHQNRNTLYCMILLGGILAAALCAFELASGGLMHKTMRPEFTGPWKMARLNRPVVIVLLTAIPCLLMIMQFRTRQKSIWALWIGLMGLIGFVCISTESQSAQLSLVVALFFYAVYPTGQRYAWIIISIFMILGIMGAPWIAQYLFDVLPPLLNNNPVFQDSYAADRLEIWSFVTNRMFDHPIIGHGIEATRAIKDFESQKLYHADTHVLHPHNFIIQIWFEFGVLGALALSGFFGGLFYILSTSSQSLQKLGLPVLMACVSVSATGYGFWQSWWLGTLFFVMSLCIIVHKTLSHAPPYEAST